MAAATGYPCERPSEPASHNAHTFENDLPLPADVAGLAWDVRWA